MHTCLNIPAIVQLICDNISGADEVDGESDYVQRNSQLFAMALTCRSFREPAIACLWETLHGIGPLIACAGDLLLPFDNNSDTQVVQLSRPTTPSDIITVKKYACLVQHFIDHEPTYVELQTSPVWEMLQRAFNNAVLFPNLRSINLSNDNIAKLSGLFDTQRLISVTMSFHILFQQSVLANFSSGCPNLTSVRLDWLDTQEEQDEIIAALPNLQRLSRLTLYGGTYNLVRALSSARCSSSLHYLQIDRFTPSRDIIRPLPSTATGSSIFPVLETIKIGFLHIGAAIAFAEFFPTISTLRNWAISLDTSGLSATQKATALLRSLKIHWQTLKDLVIVDGLGDIMVVPLSKTLLFALAANFPTLTRICISNRGGYDLVDEDMKELTEALPQIEEFRLYGRNCASLQTGVRITIACLVFFAQNCPSLTYLALGFDARVDKIPTQSESSGQISELRRLEIAFSPIGDPQRVAGFILKIFPNIRNIAYDNLAVDHVPPGRYRELWSEVISGVVDLQMKGKVGRVSDGQRIVES